MTTAETRTKTEITKNKKTLYWKWLLQPKVWLQFPGTMIPQLARWIVCINLDFKKYVVLYFCFHKLLEISVGLEIYVD